MGASSVLPLDPTSRRKKLLEYLQALKQPDGSFLMHIGGEVDVRWVSAPQRISAQFPLPNAVWGEPCGAPPGGCGDGAGASPQPPAPFSHRSAYCAAAVASLTNILTPALFAGTAEWIAR